MEKERWITGKKLIERWQIQDFELFDFLRKGLQAYTKHGIKVVDEATLERQGSFKSVDDARAWIIEKERDKMKAQFPGRRREVWRRLSKEEIDAWVKEAYNRKTPIYPPNTIAKNFSLPLDPKKAQALINEAKEYLFKTPDVEKFEREYPDLQKQVHIVYEQALKIDDAKGENYFIRNSEYWDVGFQGKSSRIQDTINIRYIVHLLNNPWKEILVSELQNIVSGVIPDASEEYLNKTEENLKNEGMSKGGTTTLRTDQDKTWDKKINRQFKELSIALEEAKRGGIPMEIDEAQKEYNDFVGSLQKVRNLKSNPDMEKARSNVKNHLSRAISNMKKAGLKELANYLTKHIQKGIKCSYYPDPDAPINWVIKY